jgi:hypothetical protein
MNDEIIETIDVHVCEPKETNMRNKPPPHFGYLGKILSMIG